MAAAWLLAPAGVPPLAALTAGVLFGGGLQVALQGPAVRRLGLRFEGSPFRDPEVRSTALQIAPRLYGDGVGQLSFLVSSRTLAALGDAFVTYNFCAFRIVDFVLGGFVVSLTRTVLPSLSEQALEKDRSAYKATVAFALRLIGFVTIPAMVGLMLLAEPIVDVVFRRGRFAEADVTKTALAVVFFALGLYAAAGVKIVTQAFYALHDTRTPVVVATFDLAVFWTLCVWLAKPMLHAGVALATSAGFWIDFLLLVLLLWRRLGSLGGRVVIAALLRHPPREPRDGRHRLAARAPPRAVRLPLGVPRPRGLGRGRRRARRRGLPRVRGAPQGAGGRRDVRRAAAEESRARLTVRAGPYMVAIWHRSRRPCISTATTTAG